MRTDVANNTVKSENTRINDTLKAKIADDTNKVVKGVRRTLQPLQKTAGDKENLVGAGRSPMPPNKEKLPSLSDVKPNKKLKPGESRRVDVADLTNAQPSAEYWEALAERRRVALEKALEENQRLSERVAILQEENAQANSLLNESRQIVEALTELLQERGDLEDESEADPNSSL